LTGDQPALLLGEGGVEVEHERIGVPAEFCHQEGHTLRHQARDKGHIARQPVESTKCAVLVAKRGSKLRPPVKCVGAFARYPVAHERNLSAANRSAPHREIENHSAINAPPLTPGHSRHRAISLQSAEMDVTKGDSNSAAYENRTKIEKCGGSETIGPRERIRRLNSLTAVRRFTREARGYWRFQPGISQRRKLVAVGLAEGEELYSNVLSQICAAAFRCNSKRFSPAAIYTPLPLLTTPES
jgi:hypothetical protein